MDYAVAARRRQIARLIGAAPGEVVVADSTSVNLYKVLSAALAIVAADAPDRRTIVSERPTSTDLCIAGHSRAHGLNSCSSTPLTWRLTSMIASRSRC